MSCRRAFEIDLVAFVADASGPEWADFRAHYPGCADCAAEVAVWTELHESLRASGAAPSPHPAEALLVAYAEGSGTLAANDRQAIERHVVACRLCADELTTLRTFDFASLTPAAATPARPAAWQRGASAARGGGLAAATRRIGRVLVHPAFAYAVVLLLLVPILLRERDALSPLQRSPRERGAVSSADAKFEQRASKVEGESRPGEAAQEPSAAVDALSDMRGGLHGEERHSADTDVVYYKRSGDVRQDVPARAPEREESAPAPPPQAHARVAAAPPAAAGVPGTPENHLAANAPAANARQAELSLQAATPAEIRSSDIGRSLRLRVPLGAGAGWRGQLEMRLVGPDPGRELRQQVDGGAATRSDATGAPQLDVPVPVDWLVPGSYVVEMFPAPQDAMGDANRFRREQSEHVLSAKAAPLRFTFTVR